MGSMAEGGVIGVGAASVSGMGASRVVLVAKRRWGKAGGCLKGCCLPFWLWTRTSGREVTARMDGRLWALL